MKNANCHPEKALHGQGLCHTCYQREHKNGRIKLLAKKSMEARFWEKVDRNGPIPEHAPSLGPCWIWKASVNNKNYGQFRLDGTMHLAHHTAWKIVTGELPTENLLHHCDTPRCVRFTHLREGTQQENMSEAAQKNRIAFGERLPQTKLTVELVREIKEMLPWNSKSLIARHFGVQPSAIYKIAAGKTWRRVDAAA